MIKEWVHRWKYKNNFKAIELCGEPDLSSYKFLKGHFIKDVFHIDDFQENIDIKTLIGKEKNAFDIFLNVNNNKVLNKIVNTNDTDNLDKVFLNFKLHDFFLQKSIDYNGKTVVSLIRKEDLFRILEFLKNNNIGITGISLGIVTLPLLFPQFNPLPDNLITDTFEFHFNNGQLTNIAKARSNTSLVYEELDGITSGQFNLYSVIVTANYAEDYLKLPECTELNRSVRNFIWGRIIKTGTISLLVFLFVTLLANYLLFDYYFRKQAALAQNFQIQSVDNRYYLKLKKELQNRIKFIKQQNLSDNTKSSFYIDRLASKIPKSILLSKLEYCPLKKKIKENQEIQIFKNTIRLEGESANKIRFVEWIEQMKKFSWIKKIDVVDYDRINSNRMKFNILIIINPKNG